MGALRLALDQSLTTESGIDQALSRVLSVRFMLGLMDDASLVPYSKIPRSVIDSPEHRALALSAAEQSVVLLTNKPKGTGHTLPLDKPGPIAVIGPNANVSVFGNYAGTNDNFSTPLQAIERLADQVKSLV